MSHQLAVRAEIVKLARLLGQDADSLEYLASVDPADIRELREQATDVLFSAHDSTLTRLAAASRMLPVGIVAAIGERAFGPTLSARMAALLDPSRAVEMAAKLPVDFLAEVAIDIDPRRTKHLLGRIPPSQVKAITRELIKRQEYVTMGRFVGELPPESVRASIAELDDATLLRVAFVLERKEFLPELVDLLPEERLDGVIDAAGEQELWAEVLDLLGHLRPEQRREFAGRAGRFGQDEFDQLMACARELDMWQSLLPLTAYLPAEAQERAAVATGRLNLDDEERQRVLEHARGESLLDELGPVGIALESSTKDARN